MGGTDVALVPYVADDGATGIVREVFDDIKSSRGLAEVPNFWRAIAHRPEYLQSEWAKLRTTLESGSIDRKVKEMIAVAVSATNNCDYCLRSHTDALRALGGTDAEIVELMSVVDFFNGSNAVASGLKVEYSPPVLADQEPS
jgi:AhpD family alkylhydroperoxidase